MKTLYAFALLMLSVPCWSQSTGWYSGGEDDLGTIPYTVHTSYVVVNEPEVHGVRIHRMLNPRTELVIEYLDLSTMFSPWSAPTFVPSYPWNVISDPLAGQVFVPGHWVELGLPMPETGACTPSSCSAPDSICSGWCQPTQDPFRLIWTCLCTKFNENESSSATLKKHRNRVLQAQN